MTRKVSICCDVVIVLGEDDNLLHIFPMYDTTLLGQSMVNQIILVANVFQNSIPSPTPKDEIIRKTEWSTKTSVTPQFWSSEPKRANARKNGVKVNDATL